MQNVEDEHKYHIAGYEKPHVYNKLGLFDLVMKGPTAVSLGLDPEYFQYYRNDRAEGPYFDTAYWRPSIYGVVVEYNQYAVEGQAGYSEWPYFSIESRLRACDSFVFRLPILESTADGNIAGIAGFAIRPIVNELLPTPAPTAQPTEAPTTEAPTTVPPTTVAPTTEAPTTEAPTTEAPTTVVPTTIPPTTIPPTTEAPTTVPPTTIPPTTEAPTTVPTTTIAPTTEAPTSTLTPTPTPEPWFPIYDPFILGDNTNYEVQETCIEEVISDLNVTNLYLAVRDAFPTKALKHTRVIALMGMEENALNLWHKSLSKQELNPAPIDMYFYSDLWRARYLEASIAVSLISLAQYTRPSRIVFGDGTFRRDGMRDVLKWMVDNRDNGYFQNLVYFQMTGHYAATSTSEDPDTLATEIVGYLSTICDDTINFPNLREFNFNNNGYNLFDASFAIALRNACNSSSRQITILATDAAPSYDWICWPLDYPDMGRLRTYYYDMTNQREIDQCQFTWNWELGVSMKNNDKPGPFPNENSVSCQYYCFCCQ